MKSAFSLIETLFAIVILGLIFAFFYQAYAVFAKNNAYFYEVRGLFEAQSELKMGVKSTSKSVNIDTNELGVLPFTETQNAHFKSLKPPQSAEDAR